MTTRIASAQRTARIEKQTPSPLLTRDLIERGGIERLAAIDSPNLKLLTDADRKASVTTMLSKRPRGDVWIFGYGSLIWNPVIDALERRVARVDGWHRSFCLSITALRATVDRPGLMLALDRGGSCYGAAYKLSEAHLERELLLLWRREMVCGAYVPRWVELKSVNGKHLGWAITFVIDANAPQYAGDLDENTIAHRLATASGGLGSSADYLFRTCDGLQANGICDSKLEHLASLVKALFTKDRCLLSA